MMDGKKAVKTVAFMMAATLLAKFLGLYREILFASIYGMQPEAQAFLAASRIPLMFFDIALGTAVSSTFIPVFNEYLENRDKEYALRFAARFVNLILIITGVLCALGVVFAGPVIGLIAGGYSPQTKVLTESLIRILFPTMIFSGVAYSFVGILQSFGRFHIPAAISLVSNAVVVLYLMIFKDQFGITGLAAIMLIGWGMQVVIQIPSLAKVGFVYKFDFKFNDEGIVKVAALALPILISSWVQPINSLVNMSLSSYLNGGMGANALDYANKLYIILAGVITYAISNLVFPSMSKLLAAGNKDEYVRIIDKSIRAVVFLILPVMTGFLVLGTPIIRLVYERGQFDSYATSLTSTALFYYSLGMLGFAAAEILNKGFYAMQDGKTPMVISMIGIAVNIGLSFLFVRVFGFGVSGLALAASIAAVLIAGLMVCRLNQKIKGILNRGMLVHFSKTLLCSIIMGISVYFTSMCFFNDEKTDLFYKILAVGVPVLTGGIVFAVSAAVFRLDEVKMAADAARHIKNKLLGK